MQSNSPLVVLVLFMGPVFGSFLGVLVERLPRGQSILTPSRCETCSTELAWRDMIPILSAVLRRGKCRNCGARFPAHLIRIEVAAGLASFTAVVLVADPVQMVTTALFLWLLVGLFYCDLLYFRLPDPLTALLFGVGLLLAVVDPFRTLTDALFSAAIASGAFLLIRWGYFWARGREGLGLGDVKLMAGIGAALGWAEVPLVTLIAAALVLSVSAIDLLRGNPLKAETPVPFGTYLCASAGFLAVL